MTRMAQHFSKLGGGGLTSDLKCGEGRGGAEETILLVGLYFFGQIGRRAKPLPQPL